MTTRRKTKSVVTPPVGKFRKGAKVFWAQQVNDEGNLVLYDGKLDLYDAGGERWRVVYKLGDKAQASWLPVADLRLTYEYGRNMLMHRAHKTIECALASLTRYAFA
jgi:hypothetical protein